MGCGTPSITNDQTKISETKQEIQKSEKQMIVLNGVTAVGKSSVFKGALKKPHLKDEFGFSVSHTTRKPREGEQDGREYYFVTDEEFDQMVKDNKFLEYTVNHGKKYGTSFMAIQKVLEKQHCILDIDYKGMQTLLKAALPQKQINILISPPTDEEFEKRLRTRGTESEEQIQTRLRTAIVELNFFKENKGLYQHEIINDVLDVAVEEFSAILEQITHQ
ncbi:Guanylate_kinase [Hexamita inflata]|uniref:guanylate kinase n=1 Tax=Hexamita inflata TaxID=28002 RepID=A0AA86R1F1_9EUKA|nr:Guanylate kinase [Hexamita inflata]